MARGKKSRKLCSSLLRPSLPEVVIGIRSLYADEVKPTGRILRRRLYERAVATVYDHDQVWCMPTKDEAIPDIDIAHVRACCESCSLLAVEDVEGGEWAVVLRDQPDMFVNCHAPDCYPDEFWFEFAMVLNDNPGLALSGGRFAGAQALVARGLPCLAGYSLGRVCHIVELAISERKILGYQSGYIRPYMQSFSMAKAESAQSQQPCSFLGHGASAMPIATFDVARSCIRVLLSEAAALGEKPGTVALSNVKRLFRSHFGVELSETMLGYTKLSDLLQDARFGDVCQVQAEWNGHLVVPPMVEKLHGISCGHGFADGTPASVHSLSSVSSLTSLFPCMLPGANYKYTSCSPSLACGGCEFPEFDITGIEPCYSTASTSAASVGDASEEFASTPGCSDVGSPNAAGSSLAVEGEICHFSWPTGDETTTTVRNTFIHAGPLPSCPDVHGCRKRSQSVPKDMRLNQTPCISMRICAIKTWDEPCPAAASVLCSSTCAGMRVGCFVDGVTGAPPSHSWNGQLHTTVPNVDSTGNHADAVKSLLSTMPVLATAANVQSGPLSFPVPTPLPTMGRQDVEACENLTPLAVHTLSLLSLSTTPTSADHFSLIPAFHSCEATR